MKDDIYKNILKNIKNCLPLNLSRYSVHEPNISLSVKNELNKCLKSTFVSSQGEYIDKLSDKLRKITGSRYILLTSSGTSALFCALNEINILNQDVIVPSMTFVATANSVIHAGGTPVFIDSSKSNLNIDHNDLKKYLFSNYKVSNGKCKNIKTKKILKCIIVVHAYGEAANINIINDLAKKYKLEVIEDAAGALGSFRSSKHVGTLSRMGIISFNGNKIITTGMGGALIFKNKHDYQSVKHKISTARLQHNWKVEHDMIGYNLRMANINAALGYGQIIDFDKIVEKKRALYERYCDAFEDNKYCYIKKSDNKYNNNWVTNLYLKDEYHDRHQAVIKSLHNHKLFVRELWKPMHLLPMFKKCKHSRIKNAVKSWQTGISLPSSYYK
ncbi:MAG: DegT/DnrJ/EryC1/StrS family aminotransferase [Gammaproteobacteria bacterium]|nr:DegT/DnrJ/EryC1/StrS family aminotransferase [Gammaproteobacteria bacterium]